MRKIKRNRATGVLTLGSVKYRPYKVGELPNSFGFIYDADNDRDGINRWFNYQGLTYLKDDRKTNQL